MSSKGKIKVHLTKEQLEKLFNKQLEKLFNKLDLNGIEDWSNEEQEEVQKLVKDFGFLFAL